MIVNPMILRGAGPVEPSFAQLVLASQQREELASYERNKVILAELQDPIEHARKLDEIQAELRGRSNRYEAELRFIATLDVPDPVPTEVRVLEACARAFASGLRPLCPICTKTPLLLGDTVCSKPACRKAAGRRVHVDWLEDAPKGPHRGRPSAANIVIQVPEDAGWANVNARWPSNRFRERRGPKR
jgi:hypothetical protein